MRGDPRGDQLSAHLTVQPGRATRLPPRLPSHQSARPAPARPLPPHRRRNHPGRDPRHHRRTPNLRLPPRHGAAQPRAAQLGQATLTHKRVFRLMRLSSLLLQPHTGRRAIRAHEGTVVAPASNQRWASDGFDIPCWNGEVVRFGRSLGPVALRPCPSPSTPTTARSWPGPAPPPAASAAR